jgi:hypothetical protein
MKAIFLDEDTIISNETRTGMPKAQSQHRESETPIIKEGFCPQPAVCFCRQHICQWYFIPASQMATKTKGDNVQTMQRIYWVQVKGSRNLPFIRQKTLKSRHGSLWKIPGKVKWQNWNQNTNLSFLIQCSFLLEFTDLGNKVSDTLRAPILEKHSVIIPYWYFISHNLLPFVLLFHQN